MLYKITPMGYFGRVHQNSRGPWFRKWYAEDDGLEWYYTYKDDTGLKYLLSNNIPFHDRQNLDRLYKAQCRVEGMVWFGSYWLGVETVLRDSVIKKWAWGWRLAAVVGLAQVYKYAIHYFTGDVYSPLIGAYLRKYQSMSCSDQFDI